MGRELENRIDLMRWALMSYNSQLAFDVESEHECKTV